MALGPAVWARAALGSHRSFLKGGPGGAMSLALGADSSGTGGWTLWASGARTGFSGHPGGFLVDGTMDATYLGVDGSLGSSGVIGVAVSRSRGGVDFESASSWIGEVDAELTVVYPYARWSPTARTDLWGMFGLGGGDVGMDGGGISVDTPGRLRMAAMGLRNELAHVGGVDLAVRADAFTVDMEADEVAGTIRAADGRAQRLRLTLDGSTAWALSSSSRLTPSVEVGARADGGHAETGVGMELGGGLAYTNARLGLDITAYGRWLAAHRDGHFGEWGGGMAVRRMPADPNRGLSFSLEPAWGEDASGVAALWEGRNLRRSGLRYGPEAEAWRPDRFDVEVAYGMDLPAGLGLLKPFGQLQMVGTDSRHVRVGTRMELAGGGDGDLRLRVAGRAARGDRRRRELRSRAELGGREPEGGGRAAHSVRRGHRHRRLGTAPEVRHALAVGR